jgi:hypothetical protein
MGAVIGFLGSLVTKTFADKVLGWLAMKALLIFLFVTVVPLILNNFAYDIIEIVMNFAGTSAAGASSLNGTMSFAGLGGWLLSVFKVPEALSVLVSALVLRVTLSMIPFIGVGK